jgi:cytoskeletal protein CcmA (bactofilin family)
MKRKLLALLAGLSIFSIMAVPAFALVEKGDQYAFIADDEVIDDDLFIVAEEVVIEGVVNGDVFAAGAKVTITGTINGDLYAAGAMIDISGTVTQDVIVAGDTITLDGANVGDGMISAGSHLSLDSKSIIGGGLLYAASNMDMNASVGRGLVGASALTSVNGSVAKNATIATAELSILPGAQINGDLKYWAEEAEELDESLVGGSIEYVEKGHVEVQEISAFEQFLAKVSGQVFSYLAALLAGVIFIAVFPKYYHRTGKEVMENPVMSLVYGLVLLFGMPFAAMLLIMTIIGAPLGLIVLAKYFIVLYLGKIFVAAIFTAALLKWTKWSWLKKGNVYLVFASMLLLYFVLIHIPFVGHLVQGISLLLAWGSMALATNATIKLLKKAKL